MANLLLIFHIMVVGYWFGSELVINSTSRYVCFSDHMPMDERTRLMNHVMNVDQHVRYALVIQFGLGFAMAAYYGYVPGGMTAAWAFAAFGIAWLAFVEVIHHLRHRPIGKRLAATDRFSRYILMAILFAIAFGVLGADWPLPFWLRVKLGLFAGVMACGVGIRFSVLARFREWAVMQVEGASPASNALVRRTYMISTSILVLLWLLILAIVVLSALKP